MNREEFLRRLEQCLKGLPPTEVEDALRYYEDYFQDSGIISDEEVIASLGDPEDVAKQILESSGRSFEYTDEGVANPGEKVNEIKVNEQKKKRSTGEWVLIVIIVICALPILLPIAGGIISAIVGIILGLAGAVFGLLVGGAVAIFSGIGTMFTTFSAGLFLMGSGLVAVAVGLLLCKLLYVIVVRFFPWVIKGMVKIGKKLFKSDDKERM